MKVEHYFAKRPRAPLKLKRIAGLLRRNRLQFLTAPGIFSKDRVDRGAALLADAAIIKPGWSVLDLGAGYGAIGLAVAKAFPSARVTLVDINERAVELCRMNAALNDVHNATALCSDAFANITEFFDTILINPPQTAGRAICNRMIEESLNHLKQGGLFQLVARHRKGGATFEAKIKELFGNVRTVAKRGGYRVYVGQKV